MATLPKAYDLTRAAVSGFFIVAPSEDCGCDEPVTVPSDDGGDPTDDSDGRRKDPDGITVESFCPDLILVSSGQGDVDFIDGNDITIGTDTTECAEGIHEASKTLIDLGQYFFEVVTITSNLDDRAFDWTVCDGVCDIGVDYRQDIEFRFIEAFFHPNFGQTIQVNVTVQSCKTLFVRTFDVMIPFWPIN